MRNIYIDSANLFAECKSKDIALDMKRFYVWLSDKYKPDNIFIFTGFLEKYKTDYLKNQEIGYSYIFKEAIYNNDEKKIKANCDVDITIQAVLDVIKNDLLFSVLITSDGDFASLVKFMQSHNVEIRVVSPSDPHRCSYLLKRIVPVTYLYQIKNKIVLENEKALNRDETLPRPFS